jgi:two-component system, chemotaxis family, protein-glutamate methylesterase/glutaminase
VSGTEHCPVRPCPLEVVVVAASAGGLQVVRTVLAALPDDFPAPVVVVQHHSSSPEVLVHLYHRVTALPVGLLEDGTPLQGPGIYVLPPRCTASVGPSGAIRLIEEATPHPGDILMRSAAARSGAQTCAVVLSGRLDDGAAGVRAVKRAGGRVIVQDPATATVTGMPSSALATGCADLVLPPRMIGPALVALALAPGSAEVQAVPPAPCADLAPA